MTPSEFRNEPILDFGRGEHREAMRAAIARVRGRAGERIPLVIGGERIDAGRTARVRNPSCSDEILAEVCQADRGAAAQAIEAAAAAFPAWSRVPAAERAGYAFRAAAILRERRLDLGATMVLEAGKTFVEADADVAETIDFLEFYGREALRLDEGQALTPLPDEQNELRYIPLGVGVVIPPWNFPGAILAGMTSAAFVTGNTVVLKPASATPITAWRVFEIFQAAGLPPGVVQFLPGAGSEIGDVLVDHPQSRFIAFTGSKEVGLRIHERAARPQSRQIWVKRTLLEMGGKDAIIVDRDADLDAAVQGIVGSAFGYQGQKCSACSRAIVLDEVYDEVVRRVVEGARTIRVGPVDDPANGMGPVIEERAMQKILSCIETGKREGRLLLGGGRAPGKGWFVEPTVFGDIAPDARTAQEEIFGPVLAFIRARDFDHALEIANGTEYGLTGAVYSRDRANLERARHEFHVGNLYFNRKCTGALVGAHPFGGFNLSGTDSKAGGKDYLLLFTQAKTVSEKR